MKFKVSNVSNMISRNTRNMGLKLRKVSPEIGMVVGTVAVVGGVIAACKATTKLSAITEPAKEELEHIRGAVENPEEFGIADGDYTEKDGRHDTFIVYRRQAFQIAKLYALPAASIGLGLGCFYGSHHILTKRNAALSAAYASVSKSFKNYRNNVIERFGTDMDRELRYNIKTKEFEETVVDGKGKEKVVKKNVEVIDPSQISEFARYFDASCREFEKDAEYNMTFLKGIQNEANDKLRVRGHLFLNEVYDMLGIERTKAGQYVGWTYNPETQTSKTEDGDGYIDFGIFKSNIEANRRFVNGYEPVVLLDFNVEGNVLDLI